MNQYLNSLKVNTEFKIKHWGNELDREIFMATTRKHNDLIDFVDSLQKQNDSLKLRVKILENNIQRYNNILNRNNIK